MAVPTHNSQEAQIPIMFVNDIHPNYPCHSLPIRALDIFAKAHFALLYINYLARGSVIDSQYIGNLIAIP